MILNIGKGVRIEATDGMNYTLSISRIREKTGAQYWDVQGYYSTLLQAVLSTLKKSLADKDEEVSIGELIRMLEHGTKRLEAACVGTLSASAAAELQGSFSHGDYQSIFEGWESDDSGGCGAIQSRSRASKSALPSKVRVERT